MQKLVYTFISIILLLIILSGCKVKSSVVKTPTNESDLQQDNYNEKAERLKDPIYTGLLTRKVIKKTNPSGVEFGEEGLVVINVCVNRAGDVVYAAYNEESSTIKTESIWKATLDRVRKFKFMKDDTAEIEQCGKYNLRLSM